MGEVPLYSPVKPRLQPCAWSLQGYLAHKKHPPPRTLQWDYTYGPMVILGGVLFLMSEVLLTGPYSPVEPRLQPCAWSLLLGIQPRV